MPKKIPLTKIRIHEVYVEREWRDCWIGLYWTRNHIATLYTDINWITLYICIIPCFPIVIRLESPVPDDQRR